MVICFYGRFNRWVFVNLCYEIHNRKKRVANWKKGEFARQTFKKCLLLIAELSAKLHFFVVSASMLA